MPLVPTERRSGLYDRRAILSLRNLLIDQSLFGIIGVLCSIQCERFGLTDGRHEPRVARPQEIYQNPHSYLSIGV